jgi:hypothetical protein
LLDRLGVHSRFAQSSRTGRRPALSYRTQASTWCFYRLVGDGESSESVWTDAETYALTDVKPLHLQRVGLKPRLRKEMTRSTPHGSRASGGRPSSTDHLGDPEAGARAARGWLLAMVMQGWARVSAAPLGALRRERYRFCIRDRDAMRRARGEWSRRWPARGSISNANTEPKSAKIPAAELWHTAG